MNYAYISGFSDQGTQLDEIISYSNYYAMEVAEIVAEESTVGRLLEELMLRLSSGDSILVNSYSNVRQNPVDVFEVLSHLAQRGIRLISVNEGFLTLEMVEFVRSMVAEVAENNCFLESLTQRNVLKGKHTKSRLGNDISNSAISCQFDVSPQSFKNFVISRGLMA